MTDIAIRQKGKTMWISPIEIIEGDIELRLEDTVFKAVQSVGIKVNKDELLKALAYDRRQYEKGYANGVEDAESKIVRCKDCKWWADIDGGVKAFGFGCCCYGGEAMRLGFLTARDWFCADGERKDE